MIDPPRNVDVLDYMAISHLNTWEDALNVPGEHPVQNGINQHHNNGQDEGVLVPLFGTLADVGPLDADALLFVLGKLLTAEAESHARQ